MIVTPYDCYRHVLRVLDPVEIQASFVRQCSNIGVTQGDTEARRIFAETRLHRSPDAIGIQ